MGARAAMMAFVLALGQPAAHDLHSALQVPLLPRDLLERPVPLRSGIGAAHDAVSTTSPGAQSFYDQGLAYLHSYVWIEAARSFHHALRLDPKLAMAEIGLSVAYAELNAPGAAHAALARARSLESGASDHDRHHIEARATQMAAGQAPRDAGGFAAYRKVLDTALMQLPSDEELWLLRGMAESSDPVDRGQGGTTSAEPFYERALSLAPDHFAARHYLAHAFENSGRIDAALIQAAKYAGMAPAIPHARHMHGHALRRAGRTDEAVAELEAADRLELAYFEAERVPAACDWHYHHNLDLLGASYQYLGQMGKAERLLKAAFALPSALVVQAFNKREWPMFLRARGRVDEALAAARVLIAHPSPVIRATGHIEAGHAMLATGQFESAANESNAALTELARAQDGAALVATSLEALQGEFFLRTGPKEKGRAMLERVAKAVRAAQGPDAWTRALFTLEAIARAAREADDWEFAGRIAQQMLDHDAAYAGTHYALALVADHDGDSSTARAEYARAGKLWSGADVDLQELATIRAKTGNGRRREIDNEVAAAEGPTMSPLSSSRRKG